MVTKPTGRPPGRPPLPEPRTERAEMRLTADERAVVEAAAVARGLSLGEYLRAVVLPAARRTVSAATDRAK